jgi:hypothetical protein
MARSVDVAILTIVTLAALFYCYEVEVFPGDTKPHALELDELLLVSTIFCSGLFLCSLRRLIQPREESRQIAPKATSAERRASQFFLVSSRAEREIEAVGVAPPRVRSLTAGRPSKNAEIDAAIDALTLEGMDLTKLPRKDACERIRQKAAELGTSVEVGFSLAVIQRSLVRRYGPRI